MKKSKTSKIFAVNSIQRIREPDITMIINFGVFYQSNLRRPRFLKRQRLIIDSMGLIPRPTATILKTNALWWKILHNFWAYLMHIHYFEEDEISALLR